MIPDRLQYVLERFWDDQKCDKISTPSGPLLITHILQKYEKSMETVLKSIMFGNLKMLEIGLFETFGKRSRGIPTIRLINS